MSMNLLKPGSYRDVFLDAHDNLSEPAKVVIRDLMILSKYFLDEKIKNEDIVRYQGRRDVVNHIIGMLNVKTEQVVMFRGKGGDDGLV